MVVFLVHFRKIDPNVGVFGYFSCYNLAYHAVDFRERPRKTEFRSAGSIQSAKGEGDRTIAGRFATGGKSGLVRTTVVDNVHRS